MPFVSDLMNPTGLALDAEDVLYVSSRHEGTVYRVSSAGNVSVYVEGMGVATGIAFDREGNLYVGDRSGTVFKDQPRTADLRLRHDGAFDRSLSSGIRSRWIFVRHRADDVELRLGAPHFARRPRRNVLSRLGTPAGHGVRYPRKSVRRILAGRKARRRAHHVRRATAAIPLGTFHRRRGVHSREGHDSGDREFSVSCAGRHHRTPASLVDERRWMNDRGQNDKP